MIEQRANEDCETNKKRKVHICTCQSPHVHGSKHRKRQTAERSKQPQKQQTTTRFTKKHEACAQTINWPCGSISCSYTDLYTWSTGQIDGWMLATFLSLSRNTLQAMDLGQKLPPSACSPLIQATIASRDMRIPSRFSSFTHLPDYGRSWADAALLHKRLTLAKKYSKTQANKNRV